MNREIELLEEISSLIGVSLVILDFRDLRDCINCGLWYEVLWIIDEFDRLSWWYNDADIVEVVAVSLEGSGDF